MRNQGRQGTPVPGPLDHNQVHHGMLDRGHGANGLGEHRSTALAISYAMGPAALVVLLVLRHYRLIDVLPIWVYLVTFLAVPIAGLAVNRWCISGRIAPHVRLATHCAAVTWTIFLTGWGPVMVMSFTIIVVVNVAQFGSRSWRPTVTWGAVGITSGQVALALHLLPSRLAPGPAQVIGFLGLFVFAFTGRMIGAAAEQTEQADAAIRRSEERFRSLVQHASDTTFIIDPAGIIRYASPAVFSLLGRFPEQLAGTVATDLIHPDDRDLVRDRTTDRFRSAAVADHEGADPALAGTPAASTWPATGSAADADPAATPAGSSELGAETFTGTAADTSTAADATTTPADASTDITQSVQFRMARADGTWCHAEAVVSDQRDNPAVTGYVANIRDVTVRAQTEAILAHRASHDPLTGLPNRALLIDRIEQALARRKRSAGPPPVVMLLDLDRFKAVNDSLGHRCGDDVLVELATRLQRALRSGDTVARLGGDEFVVLCEDVRSRPEAVDLAERILEAVDQPFVVLGRRLTLGASIGITTVDDASGVDTLLSEADVAMYLAKARTGGDRIQFFDAAAHIPALHRPHTADDLATALTEEQLELYYQPIVSARTGAVTGAEALLRWRHPDHGLLAPADFLAAAERTGMIVPIGTWVLSEACRQVQRWNAIRPPDAALGVSVNLSARQLTEPDLAEAVASSLRSAGVDPSHVSVAMELSEAMLPTDDARARETLHLLHELGIELAIDDFGNGYSSLRYVRDLPIGMLKVDRSFVSGIGRSPRDESIIRSVVALAADLELAVTAEGVETAKQFDFLRTEGCNQVQGYLFGRPRPATAGLPIAYHLAPERSPSPV